MSTDPRVSRQAPDPPENRTETVPQDKSVEAEPLESERFTERGEAAESSAYRGDGTYSGGDFAGGQVATDPARELGVRVSKDLSTTRKRKKLSKRSFALAGARKYPIPDKSHARNALARVAQHGTEEEKRTVRAAVRKRFPGIGKKGRKSGKS